MTARMTPADGGAAVRAYALLPVADRTIEAYRAAYKAANGRDVQVDYFRGWYSVFNGTFQTKFRRGQLETITAHLWNKAAKLTRQERDQ